MKADLVMFKLHLLTGLCFFLIAVVSGTANAQSNWYLDSVNYNQGPLSCNPPGGEFLDWGPRRGQADGVVQYSSSRGTNSLQEQIIAEWTRPVWDPHIQRIVMELQVTTTRGVSGGRLMLLAKTQPTDAPNRRIFSTQVSTYSRGAHSVAKIWPNEDNLYYLEVWYSSGGMCSSWLAIYGFRKTQ